MAVDRSRSLYAAGLVFAVGSAIHTVDHLRRGQGSVTEALYWVGNLALVLQAVVITLILTRHRLAPIAAASGGFVLAVGFAAAHWLPEWSALSDPVWEVQDATWFSFLASGLEIVGAVAIGITGLAVVRERGLESFAMEGRTPGRA